MNSKHARTLKAVFASPVSPSIAWADIEGLLVAAGCQVVEGAGSRVRFECRGVIASFHRPHPAKEAKRYQVKDARKYLEELGLAPTPNLSDDVDDKTDDDDVTGGDER